MKRFPTTQVVPLMEQLVEKLQLKPQRAPVLIEWIRAVVLVHAAYLMTVPGLVKQLSALYQTIDSRVGVYSKMLKLSGRLDLVMSQVAMRNDMEDSEGADYPMTLYDEEEDEEDGISDEDMMEFVGDADQELDENDDEDADLDEDEEFDSDDFDGEDDEDLEDDE